MRENTPKKNNHDCLEIEQRNIFGVQEKKMMNAHMKDTLDIHSLMDTQEELDIEDIHSLLGIPSLEDIHSLLDTLGMVQEKDIREELEEDLSHILSEEIQDHRRMSSGNLLNKQHMRSDDQMLLHCILQ